MSRCCRLGTDTYEHLQKLNTRIYFVTKCLLVEYLIAENRNDSQVPETFWEELF